MLQTNTNALLPVEMWVDPLLTVADGNEVITFHLQEAFHYHGYDAVGGVVLGFRLLQKASAILSPEAPLQRRELSLFTAFPGLGARDCFELVTRMATCEQIKVDTAFSQTTAQKGVEGRFFFQFTYRGQSVQLAPIEGYPKPEFITLGKASKQPDFSIEQAQAWKNAKYTLANILLQHQADDVIRVLG